MSKTPKCYYLWVLMPCLQLLEEPRVQWGRKLISLVRSPFSNRVWPFRFSCSKTHLILVRGNNRLPLHRCSPSVSMAFLICTGVLLNQLCGSSCPLCVVIDSFLSYISLPASSPPYSLCIAYLTRTRSLPKRRNSFLVIPQHILRLQYTYLTSSTVILLPSLLNTNCWSF